MNRPEAPTTLPYPLPILVVDRRKLPLDTLAKPLPEPTLTWTVGEGPVGGLAIDDEAGLLATGNHRGIIEMFDLATGEERGGHWCDGFVWSLTFSSDGRFLTAVGNNGSMWCWAVEGGWRLVDGVIPGTQAQNAHPWLSPSGDRMAVMKVGGLAVWDVRGLRQISQTSPVGTMGNTVVFDEAGERIFLAAATTSLNKMAPTDMIRKVNSGLEIMRREDWHSFPVPSDEAKRNRMWSVGDGSAIELHEALVWYPMNLVSFVGQRELVVTRYRLLESFDVESGTRVGPTIELPEPAREIDVRGDLVAVAGRGWLVVNWRTGELVAGRQPPKAHTRKYPRPMRIRLSQSGTHVAVTYNPGLVELYEVDRCRPAVS